jgi:hypothetical protein
MIKAQNYELANQERFGLQTAVEVFRHKSVEVKELFK